MSTKKEKPSEAVLEAPEAMCTASADLPDVPAVPNQAVRPRRGRGGTANYPNSVAYISETEKGRSAISRAVSHVREVYKMPRVKSDDELIARMDQYFGMCEKNGTYPTVESMSLYCGYDYRSLWDIEIGRRKGFSVSTADIIKKGKAFIAAVDAEMVILGEIDYTTYIFRGKNYYGMQDKVEHVLTPGTQQEEYDKKAIMQRYLLEDSTKTGE